MEKLMKNIIVLILTITLSMSCSTITQDEISDKTVIEKITSSTPHPIEPEWVTFSRQPVIKSYKVGDVQNYEVSDEFVERSLQLQDYQDRIKKWKRKNLIP